METTEFSLKPEKQKKGNWKGKLAAALAGVLGASVVGPAVVSFLPDTVIADGEVTNVEVKTWAQLKSAIEGAASGATLNIKVMNTLAATEVINVGDGKNITVNLTSEGDAAKTIYVNKDASGNLAKIDNWFKVQSGSTFNATNINFSGKAVKVTESDKTTTVADYLGGSKVFYTKSVPETLCNMNLGNYRLKLQNSSFLGSGKGNEGFLVDKSNGNIYSGYGGNANATDIKLLNLNHEQIPHPTRTGAAVNVDKNSYYLAYSFGASQDYYLKLNNNGTYSWTAKPSNDSGYRWYVDSNGKISQSGYYFKLNSDNNFSLVTAESAVTDGDCTPAAPEGAKLKIGSSATGSVELKADSPLSKWSQWNITVENHKVDNGIYVPNIEIASFTVDNQYFLKAGNGKYLKADPNGNGANWYEYSKNYDTDGNGNKHLWLWKYKNNGTLYNVATEQVIYNTGSAFGVAKETKVVTQGEKEYTFSDPEEVTVETNGKTKDIGYFIYSDGNSNVNLENVNISDLNMGTSVEDAAPVFITNGKFTMKNGYIVNNTVGYDMTAQENDWYSGQTANRIKNVTDGKKRTNTAGAIIFAGGDQHVIDGAKIIGNRADTGAIVVRTPYGNSVGNSTTATFKSGLIGGNIGLHYSGAVYINATNANETAGDTATFVMQDGAEIKDNFTWYKGGAVLVSGEENGYGKGIKRENAKARFIMEGGVIDNNTAVHRAGAIEIMSDYVYLKKGKITNNNSRVLGGAIYIEGDRADRTYTLYLPNTYIADNHAWTETKTGYEAGDYAYLKRKIVYDNTTADKKIVIANEDGTYTYNNPIGNVRGTESSLNRGSEGTVVEGSPSTSNQRGKKAWSEDPTTTLQRKWDLADGPTSDYTDYGYYSGNGGGIWTCSLGGYASVNFLSDSNNGVGAVVKNNKTHRENGNESVLDITAHSKDGGFALKESSGQIKPANDYLTTNNEQLYWNKLYSGKDYDVKYTGSNGDPTRGGLNGIYITNNNARNGGAIASNGKIILGVANDVYEHRTEVEFEKLWGTDTNNSNDKAVAFQAYIKGTDTPVPGYLFVLDGRVDDQNNVEQRPFVVETASYKAEISLPYSLDEQGNVPAFKFTVDGIDHTFSTNDNLWNLNGKTSDTGNVTEWNFEIRECAVASKTIEAEKGTYLLLKKAASAFDRDYNFKNADGKYSTPMSLTNGMDLSELSASTVPTVLKGYGSTDNNIYFVKKVQVPDNGKLELENYLGGEYTLVKYSESQVDGKTEWTCSATNAFTIDATDTEFDANLLKEPNKVSLDYDVSTDDPYDYSTYYSEYGTNVVVNTYSTIAKAYNDSVSGTGADTGVAIKNDRHTEIEITKKWNGSGFPLPDDANKSKVIEAFKKSLVLEMDGVAVPDNLQTQFKERLTIEGTDTDTWKIRVTLPKYQGKSNYTIREDLSLIQSDENIEQNIKDLLTGYTAKYEISLKDGKYKPDLDTDNYKYRLYRLSDTGYEWTHINTTAGNTNIPESLYLMLRINKDTNVRGTVVIPGSSKPANYNEGDKSFTGLTNGKYFLYCWAKNGDEKSNPVVDRCEVFEIVGTNDRIIKSSNNAAGNGEIIHNTKKFEVKLKKVSSTDPSTGLTGASFSITKVRDSSGNEVTDAPTQDFEAYGYGFVKSDLDPGIYRIHETKAPTGYNYLKGDFQVKINNDGTFELESVTDGDTVTYDSEGVQFVVQDRPIELYKTLHVRKSWQNVNADEFDGNTVEIQIQSDYAKEGQFVTVNTIEINKNDNWKKDVTTDSYGNKLPLYNGTRVVNYKIVETKVKDSTGEVICDYTDNDPGDDAYVNHVEENDPFATYAVAAKTYTTTSVSVSVGNGIKALTLKSGTRNVAMNAAVSGDSLDQAKAKKQAWMAYQVSDGVMLLCQQESSTSWRYLTYAYNSGTYMLHATYSNSNTNTDEGGYRIYDYTTDSGTANRYAGWTFSNGKLSQYNSYNGAYYYSGYWNNTINYYTTYFTTTTGNVTVRKPNKTESDTVSLVGKTSSSDATTVKLQRWNSDQNKWVDATSLQNNQYYRFIIGDAAATTTTTTTNSHSPKTYELDNTNQKSTVYSLFGNDVDLTKSYSEKIISSSSDLGTYVSGKTGCMGSNELFGVLKNILYYGYSNDAESLKNQFSLSDDDLKYLTAYAITEYTEHYTDGYTNKVDHSYGLTGPEATRIPDSGNLRTAYKKLMSLVSNTDNNLLNGVDLKLYYTGNDTDKVLIAADITSDQTAVVNSKDEMITLKGKKTWNDNGNSMGVRPGSITLKLLSNRENENEMQQEGGLITVNKPIDATGDFWEFTLGNYPKYVTMGNGVKREIRYEIQEINSGSNYTLFGDIDKVTSAAPSSLFAQTTYGNKKSNPVAYNKGMPTFAGSKYYLVSTQNEEMTVYCLNADKAEPFRNNSSITSGTQYTRVKIESGQDLIDNNIISTEKGFKYFGNENVNTLVKRLKKINHYGYPNDAAGIMDDYNLTADQFTYLTQYAVWEYTNWYGSYKSGYHDFSKNKTTEAFGLVGDDKNIGFDHPKYKINVPDNLVNAYKKLLEYVESKKSNGQYDFDMIDGVDLYVYKPVNGDSYQCLLGTEKIEIGGLRFDFTNKIVKEVKLPNAGGMGTILIFLLGAGGVGAGITGLAIRSRRKKKFQDIA